MHPTELWWYFGTHMPESDDDRWGELYEMING